jgi:hypothetical protein
VKIVGKPKPAIPFELKRSRRGHYTIATIDRALELRAKDPAAWRALPADLRSEAEESAKLAEEAKVWELKDAAREEATKGWRFHEVAVREALKGLNPRLRHKSFNAVEFPLLQEVSRQMTPPRKRGPKPNEQRIALFKKRRAEGASYNKIAKEFYPHLDPHDAVHHLRRFRHRNKLDPAGRISSPETGPRRSN